MVKTSKRPRGRPRSFDEEEAIRNATKVFWSKGYDGATIDELVAGMGVQRPSLYAIFGDKATLFMRCLEAYRESLGKAAAEALLGPKDVNTAIRDLLRLSIDRATDDGPMGCLMVCVAPIVEDERVRQFLITSGRETTQAIAQRLRQGVEANELPADFPCECRSKMLLDVFRGLIVRARIGVPKQDLLEDAERAADLILCPPGGPEPISDCQKV